MVDHGPVEKIKKRQTRFEIQACMDRVIYLIYANCSYDSRGGMRDDSLNLKRAGKKLVELELLLGTQRVHLLQQSNRTCDFDKRFVVYVCKHDHEHLAVQSVHEAAVSRNDVAKILNFECALKAGREEAGEGRDQRGKERERDRMKHKRQHREPAYADELEEVRNGELGGQEDGVEFAAAERVVEGREVRVREAAHTRPRAVRARDRAAGARVDQAGELVELH
jgi:hypothetical protein